MTLTTEQQNVITSVRDGKTVLITGSAGTGKSFLVSYICYEMDRRNQLFALTAPTGIAALNIGGTTIHNFLKITPFVTNLGQYQRSRKRGVGPDWANLKTIIVDEVSMLHPDLFILLSEICQFHKRNTLPFGGIQMIFIGDFLQLSPIHKKPVTCKYAFQTDLWNEIGVVEIELTRSIRQQDSLFAAALNEFRIGKVARAAKEMIKICTNNTKIPGKKYTHLCALNKDCDIGNARELKKLGTEERTYHAVHVGNERLLKDCLAEITITLRVGATVMLLRNLPEHGLCNGSIGTVVQLEPFWVSVQFNSGLIVVIERYTWEIRHTDSKSLVLAASRTQIPLRLAYFISIHKSQSLSIDHLVADCKDIFAQGQLYVMLSRAKTMEGLIIRNFRPSALITDKIALDFYAKRIEEVETA